MLNLDFLSIELLGNSVKNYLWFVGAILVGLAFKKLISKYLSHLLFKLVKNRDSEIGVEKFDNLLTKPISFYQ